MPTVRDARGQGLPAGGYARVVSLVPSITETLIELGLGERLVGRTRFCVHPAETVAAIPTVGGTKTPDLDAIRDLAPDLVLACREENRREDIEALEDAGVAVHLIDPRTLDDVETFLAAFADLLEARRPVEALLAELAAARERAGVLARRLANEGQGPPGALCFIWRKPWMLAGRDCYINGVMEELGLANRAPDAGRYPALAPEALAALGPALVLLPDEPFAFTAEHAAELAALGVAQGAADCLLVEGEMLSWYGTRSPRALDALGRRLAAHFGVAAP
jgi:ABC-type Fe3+-hydroxamate transport system substrate-binding protein